MVRPCHERRTRRLERTRFSRGAWLLNLQPFANPADGLLFLALIKRFIDNPSQVEVHEAIDKIVNDAVSRLSAAGVA
jgi:hypothetical protein